VDRGISPSKSSLLGGVKPEHDAGGSKRAEIYPPVLSVEQAAIMRELKPFLKAIADVNRLAILQELSQQDGLNVLDLADRLLLSQPLTSWHLLILKRAHLVQPTHLGRQHVYRLNRQRLQEYREMFDLVTDL
jgi:DNA-binding transcriptional ArsR family regulator